MLKNIKAALFDLDGTLVDSMWIWKDIDIDFLKLYNLEYPHGLQQCIEGMSFVETATYFKERFNIQDSIDTIMKIWNDMARDKYLHKVPLKPGAKAFLQYLQNTGIKLGIATSNSVDLVTNIARVHGFDRYFGSIRTSCQAGKGKPHPDIYLLVANDLQVKPEECLVFEDIPVGIMAGKNAGMKVCSVYDEYSVRQDAEKRNLANYYIHSYEQILNGTYEVLNHV